MIGMEAGAEESQLLRLVLDSVPALVSYVDTRLHFRFANRAYADWFGRSPEDFCGSAVSSVFTPQDYEAIEPQMRRALAGETIEFCRIFGGTAARREVAAKYVPDFGPDGVRGFVVQVTDVSRQASAVRALRASEAQFRTLLAHTPDIISRFDRSYRFLYISPAVERVLGLPPEQHIGKRHAEIGVPAELAATLEAELEAIFTTGERRTVNFSIPGPDGTLRYYEGLGIPEKQPYGHVSTILTIVRDITAQYQSQELLRASEARFRGIVETASEGIWIIDPQGVTTFTNDRMTELLGYKPGELLGRSCFEFVHPSERERARNGVQKRLSGFREPVEYRAVRKDGSEVWLQYTATNILDDNGTVTGLLGLCTDVTERVEREALLRASEERYRSLVTATSSIVWISGPDGAMHNDTAVWADYTGKALSSGPEPWLEVLHPDDQLSALQSWHSARATVGVLEYTGRIWHHASQRYRWCTTRAVPLLWPDGSIREWIGTTTDVHDRSEAQARYEALFSASRDGILIVNDEGIYVDVNPAYCELVKSTRQEMVGKPFGPFIPDGRMAEAAEAFAILKRDGKFMGEFPLQAADGTVVELEWQSVANFLPGLHYCMARDVTQRKRFEQQLQQTQKLESLGVLAGGIAHDFNNLLVGMMGNASLAMDALPVGSAARPMLDDVVRASDRASQLTRQLLAYAGKARLATEPVDLTRLVNELSGLLGASIPKAVRLDMQLPAKALMVDGDSAQLQQVVMNLIINGAEAIPAGSHGTVRVSLQLRAPTVADRQHAIVPLPESAPLYLVLRVSDTGTGMTREIRDRIFDPFFTTKFQGRGLGLSAVLGIIKSHKGGMALETEAGKGTTFQVFLPRSEAAPVSSALAVEPDTTQTGGAVLVVDDEEVVQTFLKRLLTRAGFEVVLASNGEEAIERVQQIAGLRAIVLDLAMPVMSGDQAAPQLRKLKPNVPIVLSSGYPESEALGRFSNTGITAFLQKPYTSSALLTKLRALLR